MWLSAIFFTGALQIIQGLHLADAEHVVTDHDPCKSKILSCDIYRQPFYDQDAKHMGLFTNIVDLKKACKSQDAYTLCMVQAEKFCGSVLSPVSEELLKWGRFAEDVCRPFSPWQQLYLREAECINKYTRSVVANCIDKADRFDYKTDNPYLLGCKYLKIVFDCSATTAQEKCGFYAGSIFKKFLKFHSTVDYGCAHIDLETIEEYFLSSTPIHDLLEAIFETLEEIISAYVPRDGTSSIKNTNLPDNSENQVPKDLPTEKALSFLELFHPLIKEVLTTTKTYSIDLAEESEDITTEPDQFVFPALPKNHYVHKNRTTFALYADLEMGHTKYIGCGEADIFWVMLPPIRNTYCSLADLKAEYSAPIFKCTLCIDAPCSPEFAIEDASKNAQVFNNRYAITILTPLYDQRLVDMAKMNVHYLKVFKSSSTNIPEEAVNLWTEQGNKASVKQTPPSNRKGDFEFDDDLNSIPQQHSIGSGQKKDTDTKFARPYEYEYYDEPENMNYYPLDEEDDDIGILTNEVIYIEDENGDLISLHDRRSPIYSKSMYKPHSLFRPRIGSMPMSRNSRKSDKYGTNAKNKLMRKSNSRTGISKSKSKTSSNVNSRQREYFSKEAEEFNQKKRSATRSSAELYVDINVKSYFGPKEVYVVTTSTEIKVPEFRQAEEFKEEQTVADSLKNAFKQKDNYHIGDDSRYLDQGHSSAVMSARDSKASHSKRLKEYHGNELNRAQYKLLGVTPEAKVKSEKLIDPEKRKRSRENRSMSERELNEIIRKLSEIARERSREYMDIKRNSLSNALADNFMNFDGIFKA